MSTSRIPYNLQAVNISEWPVWVQDHSYKINLDKPLPKDHPNRPECQTWGDLFRLVLVKYGYDLGTLEAKLSESRIR